ncbi:MAG: TspO/MBR family protein [Minisyncoccia bacterium]|jgi:tryptophan-rich sensory protein
MHLSYILIPLVTILVAFVGGRLTVASVKTWYVGLRKPSWTPPGAVIGTVWTVLYILAALSALIVWNLPDGASVPAMIAVLFYLNAAVNVFWSYVFFYLHKMGPAIWVCLFLDITIILLIQFIAPISPLAAWLLVPYAAWVTFASYLNYRVWEMNR